MPNKNYTVLLIPEGSHKVRRFMVGRKWLYSLAATLGVTLLFGSFLLLDYFRTNVDRSELKRLRVQNQCVRRPSKHLPLRLLHVASVQRPGILAMAWPRLL